MKNDVGTWLCMIFLLLCFRDFGPASDRTTIYFGMCSTASLAKGECIVTKAGPETVFRAIAESQSVISLDDGTVYRLQDCEVLDAKNWACGQLKSPQSMKNGEYVAPWESMTVRPVSRLRWWTLRATDESANALQWLKTVDVLAWVIGLTTLVAAFALPRFLFHALNRKFPWLDKFLTDTVSTASWKLAPLRVAASASMALGLVLLGFMVIAAGVALYDFLRKG